MSAFGESQTQPTLSSSRFTKESSFLESKEQPSQTKDEETINFLIEKINKKAVNKKNAFEFPFIRIKDSKLLYRKSTNWKKVSKALNATS